MKKAAAWFLTLVMVFAMTGCNKKENDSTKEKADTCYLLTTHGQQEMDEVRIHGISILLVDII